MNTNIKYISPEIIKVELDQQISLSMASDYDPMSEPTDWSSKLPDNFKEDPFELT